MKVTAGQWVKLGYEMVGSFKGPQNRATRRKQRALATKMSRLEERGVTQVRITRVPAGALLLRTLLGKHETPPVS